MVGMGGGRKVERIDWRVVRDGCVHAWRCGMGWASEIRFLEKSHIVFFLLTLC